MLTLSLQQQAQLQAMGVDIFESLQAITLQDMPWLPDLCKLLDIEASACVFDASVPYFDEKTKTLHLPAQSYADETSLKKLIWQHVRQWASA